MELATKVDRETLVQGLNEDLAHEYQAVIMYTSYAAMASGIHRPILKEFFEAEILEELEHARFLAQKITALGGTPTTEPAPFELETTSREMLRQVRDAELETIERYVQRRAEAESYVDFGLVNDLEDIISDETRHMEETEKLLRGLEER